MGGLHEDADFACIEYHHYGQQATNALHYSEVTR
jgi:hypothetical protein